ncbi:hypothetical protein [Stieleria varia]|uniref:Uncharacterized protein n=1 Tax=Stieleria varia TaxID=2528005 RepID=A0A5C6A2J9_9BACT|nr:hypothetical protein [Stieleria varia]TWT93739.1 hypothetical protein Pla52n_55670 [Stieleria varia]
MAKFYVQCGPVDLVLDGDSPQQAALAAIDRALSPHLWIYDDPGLTENECRQHLMLEALLHLPPSITVSERGFGADDAVCVPTPETIQMWHALMVGVRRLLMKAGIDRTVAVLAGSDVAANLSTHHPRRAR